MAIKIFNWIAALDVNIYISVYSYLGYNNELCL